MSIPNWKPMKPQAGYTLIEVLIMLAVTAILAATVLETVRASTSNGVRIENAARTATQDYITLASVRRAVEASRPDYRDQPHVFEGDETRFSALTSYPITASHPGLQPFTLSLENGSDGVRLIYEDQGGRFPVQYWPGGQGRLSYFGEAREARIGFTQRPGAPRDLRWTSDWPERRALDARTSQTYYEPLPLAIRAEIDREDGQDQVIVFHLPVTAAPRPRIEDILGTIAQ